MKSLKREYGNLTRRRGTRRKWREEKDTERYCEELEAGGAGTVEMEKDEMSFVEMMWRGGKGGEVEADRRA